MRICDYYVCNIFLNPEKERYAALLILPHGVHCLTYEGTRRGCLTVYSYIGDRWRAVWRRIARACARADGRAATPAAPRATTTEPRPSGQRADHSVDRGVSHFTHPPFSSSWSSSSPPINPSPHHHSSHRSPPRSPSTRS